jgi:drug/metabolite transporter (DMT)-like permease
LANRDEPKGRALGVVLAILAAPAFGTGAIFGKVAYASGGTPLAVLLGRFAIAAAVMVLIVQLRGATWPRGRQFLTLFLVGVFAYGGMALSFFHALEHASAGLTGLLLYFHPALIAVGAVLLGWERFDPVKFGAVAIAVIGCALTAGAGGGTPLGIALGISAAVFLALYVLAASRLLRHVDMYAATAVFLLGCTFTMAVLSGIFGATFPSEPRVWMAIAGLGLVSSMIPTLLMFAALKRLPPSDTTTIMTIEPVFTMIAGVVLLGESVHLLQIVGAALIVVSIVILARR